MAVSLNSVVGFNATHVSRSSERAAAPRAVQFTSPSSITVSRRRHIKKRTWAFCRSVKDSNRVATNTSDEVSVHSEGSVSDNQVSPVNASSLDAAEGTGQLQTSADGSGPQTSEATNGSVVSSYQKQDTSSSTNQQSTSKRSPLTARERLRAARVLSRYTETKASKSDMGSKVLDALKESDRGKRRSRLPEAPTNLFDDSKRGLPKPGLTFQFPGGMDLFVIAFSFVFISTVMFATTYLVWKVGAIHFNEY